MPFNADKFRHNMAVPVASPAMFDVQFTAMPSKLFSLDEYRDLQLRCEEGELPALGFQPTFMRTYGPVHKIATGQQYDDLTLTFIVSETMKEKEIFDRWTNYIIDHDTNNSKYYDDYVGECVINQYARTGDLIYQVKLRECWPSSINPMKVAWGSKNEYHRLQVNFSYYKWDRLLDARSVDPDARRQQPQSAIQKIENLGKNAIAGVKKAFDGSNFTGI